MNYIVISKTKNGDLEVAKFKFKSDAQIFIKAMDMPRGYHRIIELNLPKKETISEQLNRTQME